MKITPRPNSNRAIFQGRGIAGERATPVGRRVIIVGATGMVGGNALHYALGDPAIERVTAIGQRELGFSHPKLKQVLHSDFADCTALAEALVAQDAAVFCLGTYTGVVTDARLREITVSYMVEFARVLRCGSPNAAFLFLSGSGADPASQRRISFERYKGEAENALFAARFPRVYVFRPAYIFPVKPRKSPNSRYRLLRAIYPSFRVVCPNQAIRADDLARVMVDCAVRGAGGTRRPHLRRRGVATRSGSQTSCPPGRFRNAAV
jgi:uncharacterized protein YbjT (DUF2867 family)